MGGSGGLGK